MFIRYLLTLSILAVAGFTTSVAAQGVVDSSPTLSVSGKAELFVEPDLVSFRLDVTKANKDLKIAKMETDKVVTNIRTITDKYELKNDAVSVTYISVEQKFRYIQTKDQKILDEDGEEIGEKEFLGYEASTYITIKLDDLSKFQPLFEEMLGSGVTEIDQVSFQTSKLREAKDKARELAMVAAKEKAAAMAGAIGQTIGKAIKITEGTNRSSYSNISGGVLSSNNNLPFELLSTPGSAIRTVSSSYSPGVITVDAEVSVIFLLN